MLFSRRQFFVKERVAILKLTDTYDILDPETQSPIGVAKDEPKAFWKFMRLLIKKHILPTAINVYESESLPPVLTLAKKPGFLRISVAVETQGRALGLFKSKFFSLGGGFFIYDQQGQQIGEVKGDWKGWNFRVLDNSGRELGLVTKKWAGIGKELFTTADNYMISLSDGSTNPDTTALLMAAGLAIDVVFKEKQ